MPVAERLPDDGRFHLPELRIVFPVDPLPEGVLEGSGRGLAAPPLEPFRFHVDLLKNAAGKNKRALPQQ